MLQIDSDCVSSWLFLVDIVWSKVFCYLQELNRDCLDVKLTDLLNEMAMAEGKQQRMIN